jgi:hypothetical protein
MVAPVNVIIPIRMRAKEPFGLGSCRLHLSQPYKENEQLRLVRSTPLVFFFVWYSLRYGHFQMNMAPSGLQIVRLT